MLGLRALHEEMINLVVVQGDVHALHVVDVRLHPGQVIRPSLPLVLRAEGLTCCTVILFHAHTVLVADDHDGARVRAPAYRYACSTYIAGAEIMRNYRLPAGDEIALAADGGFHAALCC